MNKILFSDFDGTLFFKEGFHQEDIEAIKTFQSKGNKFALCTGRPLGGVNALMKGKIIPDYYVLCTGGLVLDKNYQVIYAQEIPFELVKEVCQKYENETIIGPHCLDEKYLYFKYFPNDAPSYIKQFDSIDEFKNRKMDICCWAGVVMCVLDVFVSVNKNSWRGIMIFFSGFIHFYNLNPLGKIRLNFFHTPLP